MFMQVICLVISADISTVVEKVVPSAMKMQCINSVGY